MILGIGTDLVDSRRIQAAMNRYPDKFVKRVFTDAEINAAEKTGNPAGYLAKRFAVKEAVYKALSASGLSGCGWREAEILSASSGAPTVNLTGRCKTALETMTPDGYNANLAVSLSDEPPYALAFIVISAVPAEGIKSNE
ncbi:MAG: holo-ACP synthase [Proteobacteria bacterium]|nr:holo-ACP synthase [Pseudomonadota bacterium]MDA0959313.1 holo-ACP synthase [Pseudomonadota bacterium]MDA1151363.1 holo-ACP synthase [Pseudomonadota bacterium]